MDCEAFSNRFTNYLNCCLFCLPRPAFWVLRQTSEEHFIFKTKKQLVSANARLALGHTGNRALFPSFHPPTSNHLISAPKKVLGPAGFARLNPAADLIHGVFPFL